MSDALLIPDGRPRQSLATRNRLLEQTLKNLAAIQRRAMREKDDDLDALIIAITRLTTSIASMIRLHHQIAKDEPIPDTALTTMLRLLGLDEDTPTTKETP